MCVINLLLLILHLLMLIILMYISYINLLYIILCVSGISYVYDIQMMKQTCNELVQTPDYSWPQTPQVALDQAQYV